ncbi:MAG: hypothetical protein ACW975_05825 [Candidatus Thorarchaeota archaeon]|jgi:hypothetical protein
MLDPPVDPEGFIRAYAPILHFHPREGEYCCYPSDAEETFSKYSSDWSQFKKDLTPKTLQPDAPCYYEYWQDENMFQVKYWFWYQYNKFPRAPFGQGRHLGDWEHVEIRHFLPVSETPGSIWLLSNHLEALLVSHPGFYTLPGFDPEPNTLTDNHVHVWVALGSHANYPLPSGRKKRIALLWKDITAKGGEEWHTEQVLKPIDATNFVDFEGRWGNKRSPRGPRNPYNNRSRNAPLVKPIPVNP